MIMYMTTIGFSRQDDGWGERVESPAFETEDFHTLILDSQRGTFTVL
jgi:hypothetical protein